MQQLNFGQEVAKALPKLMREFTKRQQDFFSKGQLTVPQLVVLEFLADRGFCKMKDLAQALNFTMSAVTAIVDKMTALHLVKRERSKKDRRVVNVILLEKGRRIVAQIRTKRIEGVNELFSSLSEKDKLDYLRILSKVSDSLGEKS